MIKNKKSWRKRSFCVMWMGDMQSPALSDTAGMDLKGTPAGQLCYTVRERGGRREREEWGRAVCLAAVPGLFKLLMDGRWCRNEQSLNCLLGPGAKSPSSSFILIKHGCGELSAITDLNYKINLLPHVNFPRCNHCHCLLQFTPRRVLCTQIWIHQIQYTEADTVTAGFHFTSF